MKVISVSSWDEKFFKRFADFKNKIHKNIPTSFPESAIDYAKYFASDSVFSDDFSWEAFLVEQDEVVLAKAILCWRKDSQNGNLGFLDWENNEEAASLLINSVLDSSKGNNLKGLKTPVDINFFVKYRIKKPGGGKPFWGEPVYPDYYHDLFLKTGFEETGHWDTYRLNKVQGIIDYFSKRKKLAKKTTDSNLRTTIRCVNMNDWDNELKIIYELFLEAYKSMPEWEPVSFKQFHAIYDDFKYIINPLYAYIVELQGKPVGFSINFTDPLSILQKIKGKKLNQFQKLILFAKLRTNLSCFLIAHVGKIPGPNGEEIKGVQIQASKKIQFFAIPMRKLLVTFQMINSPSRRSFETSSQTLYSEYVLYGRKL